MAKEITLALGGGGIKGVSHIGILKRIEELGYKIQAVAGTSVGALVGSLYCAGYTPSEIAQMIYSFDQRSFFTHRSEGAGLLSLQSVTEILINKLGDITFNDLKIKFSCTSVDIKTSREYVFTRERVIDAVLASIAVPGIFPPKIIDDKEFVDGAVLDPVPVSLARWLAPDIPVVAICLSSRPENWSQMDTLPISAPIPVPIMQQFSKLRITQAFNIFTKSIDVSSKMLTELRLIQEQPDVIIRPDVERFGIIDQVNPEELINLGIQAVDLEAASLERAFSLFSKLKRMRRTVTPPARII